MMKFDDRFESVLHSNQTADLTVTFDGIYDIIENLRLKNANIVSMLLNEFRNTLMNMPKGQFLIIYHGVFDI